MSRTVISSGGGGASGGTTLAPTTNNWATGTFGTGQLMTFGGAGAYTFVVPTATTSIRVRCFGAGGSGGTQNSYSGGAGGGFALGTFTVTGGSSHVVTVGAGGQNGATGGTSSFGSLISATGGTGSSTNSSQKAGGMGSGGIVNYQGGDAQGNYSGGGGVACIFGRGMPGSYSGGNYPTGSGGYGRPGGAGGGFGKNGSFYTSDGKGTTYGTFGIIQTGAEGRQQSPEASVFYISPAAIPNCIDMLGTGPGGVQDGGKGYGFNGGGGAAHNGSNPGAGGWPGGGGGSGGSASSPYGNGADGCVIVEY